MNSEPKRSIATQMFQVIFDFLILKRRNSVRRVLDEELMCSFPFGVVHTLAIAATEAYSPLIAVGFVDIASPTSATQRQNDRK